LNLSFFRSIHHLSILVENLKKDEQIRSFPTAYLVLMFPEKNPRLFDLLIHPYDGPYYWERSGYTKFEKIKIPCYMLSRWTASLTLRPLQKK
jgi:hypothetical protein